MRRLLACLLLVGLGACSSARPEAAAPGPEQTCDLPPRGPVTVEQIPEGSSVLECDAVGRTVVWEGGGVTVPAPGAGVDLFVEPLPSADPPGSFGISVSEAGTVSYDFHSGGAAVRTPEARVVLSGRVAHPHVSLRTWGCGPFRIDRAVRVGAGLLRVVGRTPGRCRPRARAYDATERLTRADRLRGNVTRVVVVDLTAGTRLDAVVLRGVA